jgi:hypothetical protein
MNQRVVEIALDIEAGRLAAVPENSKYLIEMCESHVAGR